MNRAVLAGIGALLLVGAAAAQEPDRAKYEPKRQDPVLKEMEKADDAAREAAAAETSRIREEQEAAADQEKEAATVLRFDMADVVRPESPEAFDSAFHFPPVAQYLTGTCWSFSTTSFYESEVARLTGRHVKLSEIWTVYWEYVEKMKGFVQARGDQPIEEGSESNAVNRIWKTYGVVPESAYPGVLDESGRHDHSALVAELQSLGQWAEENDYWDEDTMVAMTRVVLDRFLGRPPETFTYEGAVYSPKQFLADVLQLHMDDYVELMSTLSVPFYTQGEYDVPDNWWHDASYYNVPLDEWYSALAAAVDAGYTVSIGGDVSEPGLNGAEDIAIVPTFDIPQAFIDQSSREFRFDNHTSTDDHGIHLVGHTTTPDGHAWYLIKDSGRSSRHGRFEGYYFYRDDYIRLKMLTYTIHKDAVADLLAKFETTD